jgi:hypothetical protein
MMQPVPWAGCFSYAGWLICGNANLAPGHLLDQIGRSGPARTRGQKQRTEHGLVSASS